MTARETKNGPATQYLLQGQSTGAAGGAQARNDGRRDYAAASISPAHPKCTRHNTPNMNLWRGASFRSLQRGFFSLRLVGRAGEGPCYAFRPSRAVRPMGREPRDDLVILLGRERLALPDAHEEPPISCTQLSNGGIPYAARGREPFGKDHKMTGKLCFHGALIVGYIPLCNRKAPISQGWGKFPMIAL
ncbi:MAG: hypothetical protein JWM58_562 [Rhizobium sp.]|nr:hypothetical protein [Rhizobium sp.]